MRIIETGSECAEDRFPNMVLVRRLGRRRFYAAGTEQPLLVLVDSAGPSVTVFEYDTVAERDADEGMIRRLPDADGDTAVPARLRPGPPPRHAQDAKELPAPEPPHGN